MLALATSARRATSDPQPDLVICTLDDGAEIRMEFTSPPAKAVPARRNRAEDAPIGLIPVDSLYSPVRKVPIASRTPARPGSRL